MQQTLVAFIVKAKVATYASDGEAGETKLPDGGNEYTFIEGDYLYKDRYYGFTTFIGEEIVFLQGKPIWGMNYYGRTLSRAINTKELYGFLRQAMKQVSIERPFRGPKRLEDGRYRYEDTNTGDTQDFQGIERIYYNNEEVYRLDYHGGIIPKE